MTAIDRDRADESSSSQGRPAAWEVPSDHANFFTACEVYIVAVLATQFAVLGTFIVGDIALFFPVLIVGGIGLLFIAPRELLMRARLNVPLLMLVAWYALSYLWNANEPEWRRSLMRLGILPIVSVVVLSMIPFGRIIVLIKRLTVGVIVAIFVGTAISPQTMTFHIDDATGERSIPGWHGTFDHKNGMMAFLMVGVITFWVFETNRTKKWLATAAVISLAVLGQSGSGTATLVVIALACFSLRLRQGADHEKESLFAIIVTATWVLMAALVGLFGPTLVNFFGKDLTFTGRTIIWSASWRMISEQPWIGYGLGGVWTNQGLQPTAELTRLIGFRVGHSHNGFLELLIQVGFVGLGLFLLMAFVGVRRLWRARFSTPKTARWGLMICLTMFLLSLSEAMTTHAGYATLLAFMCVVPVGRDPEIPGPERQTRPADPVATERS